MIKGGARSSLDQRPIGPDPVTDDVEEGAHAGGAAQVGVGDALVVAGLLDVAWAIAMKQAQGYTPAGWTVISLMLLAGFVLLLGRALAALPVGTAYAVWTGIGAVGAS